MSKYTKMKNWIIRTLGLKGSWKWAKKQWKQYSRKMAKGLP